jgi:hypothetical protein
MVREGTDVPALRDHAAGCAVCQETLLTAACLHEVAATPLDGPSSLDPRDLWWKAQLLSRWDAQRQATAPIEVGERVQIWIGLAGVLIVLMYVWRQFGSWSLPASALEPWGLTQLSQTLSAIVIAGVILLVVTTGVAIGGLVADE